MNDSAQLMRVVRGEVAGEEPAELTIVRPARAAVQSGVAARCRPVGRARWRRLESQRRFCAAHNGQV